MNKIWTATQAAEELGVTPTWIGVALKKLGKEKAGGIYLIDEETMEYLRSRKGKRGRPKGAKNKHSATSSLEI